MFFLAVILVPDVLEGQSKALKMWMIA